MAPEITLRYHVEVLSAEFFPFGDDKAEIAKMEAGEHHRVGYGEEREFSEIMHIVPREDGFYELLYNQDEPSGLATGLTAYDLCRAGECFATREDAERYQQALADDNGIYDWETTMDKVRDQAKPVRPLLRVV